MSRVAPPSAPPPAAPAEPEGDAVAEEPAPPSSAPQGDTCGLRATLKHAPSTDGSSTRYLLTLKNEGKRSVRLVLPGDGSTEGWRTPILTWSASRNGKEQPRAAVGRCGLMNPIAASEIFTLAPGASKDLAEWVGQPYFAPGTYDVRLRYRNDPTTAPRKGPVAPEVADLIAKSSACDVTSNAIRVTIGP